MPPRIVPNNKGSQPMITLPIASPFVVLVLATLAVALGLRRTSVLIWLAALALMVYSFAGHVTDPLKIAL